MCNEKINSLVGISKDVYSALKPEGLVCILASLQIVTQAWTALHYITLGNNFH